MSGQLQDIVNAIENLDLTGNISAGEITPAMLAANAVLAGKAKIAIRTLTIGIGSKTATVTNTADINGVPMGHYFTSATLDATATGAVLQFVASTGQIIITAPANATAATAVAVPILQAV
jgi:hypothetical protein